MPLPIETFSNRHGGFAYFKALGHPQVVSAATQLVNTIRKTPSVAIYDPAGQLNAFAALHNLDSDDFDYLFVQDTLAVGQLVMNKLTQPITELSSTQVQLLFVPVFDSKVCLEQIAAFIPNDCRVLTLDDMRLADKWLTNKRHYLSPLNFATNFAFFRDEDNHHTRIVTANYWSAYGANNPFLWCRLFDKDGHVLVDFERPLGKANASVIIDSRDIRAEFNLPEFCGQLFISVINGAGHDIVKYAVDTFGDDDEGSRVSCTHDANAWPADFYAGLPAPQSDEKVILWVQNSHPTTIPSGDIGINLMGDDDSAVYLQSSIPPFASLALDVSTLLPQARWPQQIEIRAGKWFVRPRYEIIKNNGSWRINHPNVERTDLQHDEKIREITPWVGKGFILPAPILPTTHYVSECLPTPMSRAQTNIPLIVVCRDASGDEVSRTALGRLPRNHNVSFLLSDADFASGYGHAELLYDLDISDGFLDGWLHSLFRYTDCRSGHAADTSFGAHMFNHIMTFHSEPQSYKGPPPGLSTRLFLRLAPMPADTFCHLIYPVSQQWLPHSQTRLELKNSDGDDIAFRTINIPSNGSYWFSGQQLFSKDELHAAVDGYILIRDTSCRLFGYHGVKSGKGFALDHMFGF